MSGVCTQSEQKNRSGLSKRPLYGDVHNSVMSIYMYVHVCSLTVAILLRYSSLSGVLVHICCTRPFKDEYIVSPHFETKWLQRKLIFTQCRLSWINVTDLTKTTELFEGTVRERGSEEVPEERGVPSLFNMSTVGNNWRNIYRKHQREHTYDYKVACVCN